MAKKHGFYGGFPIPKLLEGKYTKALNEQCEIALREAAREWVRAVYIRIPIWTGMARGSIKYAKGRSGTSAGQFLASYLRIAIPISPIVELRPDKTSETGGKKSRYTLSSYKGKFNFTFQTTTPHLVYLDIYPSGGGNPEYPRPWESFKAGRDAFFNYLNANLKKRIPKIKDFIEIKTVLIRNE